MPALFERMIVLPEDQYMSMKNHRGACFEDSVAGNVEGQINHFEMGENARVVLKPNGSVTASHKSPKKKSTPKTPPAAPDASADHSSHQPPDVSANHSSRHAPDASTDQASHRASTHRSFSFSPGSLQWDDYDDGPDFERVLPPAETSNNDGGEQQNGSSSSASEGDEDIGPARFTSSPNISLADPVPSTRDQNTSAAIFPSTKDQSTLADFPTRPTPSTSSASTGPDRPMPRALIDSSTQTRDKRTSSIKTGSDLPMPGSVATSTQTSHKKSSDARIGSDLPIRGQPVNSASQTADMGRISRETQASFDNPAPAPVAAPFIADTTFREPTVTYPTDDEESDEDMVPVALQVEYQEALDNLVDERARELGAPEDSHLALEFKEEEELPPHMAQLPDDDEDMTPARPLALEYLPPSDPVEEQLDPPPQNVQAPADVLEDMLDEEVGKIRGSSKGLETWKRLRRKNTIRKKIARRPKKDHRDISSDVESEEKREEEKADSDENEASENNKEAITREEAAKMDKLVDERLAVLRGRRKRAKNEEDEELEKDDEPPGKRPGLRMSKKQIEEIDEVLT